MPTGFESGKNRNGCFIGGGLGTCGSYTIYRHRHSQETLKTKRASGNMTVTQSSYRMTSEVSVTCHIVNLVI